MPAIKVFSPFSFKLSVSSKRRSFVKGIHYVSEQEITHGFMQAVIREGRAQECSESLLPADVLAQVKAGEKSVVEGYIPTREEYEAMDIGFLKEAADACGISFAANIGKAKLIDKIMAGLEDYQGCPVVKINGEWVIKDKEQ